MLFRSVSKHLHCSVSQYMVRSARRRSVWNMWYIVGWSPSGLSASLLSSRNFCSLLLWSRTIFAFRRFKACIVWSLGPVSAIHHTCVLINGSPSHSGPFGARLVHVGIVVLFSFYRGGPTALLGQESALSAVLFFPIEFSPSPCMPSQLLQRCPFSIARVPSA